MRPWTRWCERGRRAWTPSNKWRGGAGCRRGKSMRSCCGMGRSGAGNLARSRLSGGPVARTPAEIRLQPGLAAPQAPEPGRLAIGRRIQSCPTVLLVGLLAAAAVLPAQDYVDGVVERARKE